MTMCVKREMSARHSRLEVRMKATPQSRKGDRAGKVDKHQVRTVKWRVVDRLLLSRTGVKGVLYKNIKE